MSTTTVVNTVNDETLRWAPTVLGTILAVENAAGSALPGTTKAQIVANAVIAGASIAGQSPNLTVASIGQLTSLLVSILNATGVFGHTVSAANRSTNEK